MTEPSILNLIITIAIVLITITLINKGFPNTLVFLCMGLVTALIITFLMKETNESGELVRATITGTSSGNFILDIFEGARDGFSEAFSQVGMSMLPIFGYSVYMGKIKASGVLGRLIASPISKSKNPYFVGVFMAVVICGLMRIAIVSAVAIMALFMTTLYPALRKAGLSRASAISAVFLGTSFDWGPADFVVAKMFSALPGEFTVSGVDYAFNEANTIQSAYFLNASIKVVPIVLLIVAATSGFIMQFIDKKAGYVLGSDAPEDDIIADGAEEKIPAFYAILPLLPMIIILIFSPLFAGLYGKTLNISVVASVVISIIIVFIIETIRKKGPVARLKDAMSWVTGMGEGFSSLLVMVMMLKFLANMLIKLKGFDFLVNATLNAGVSGVVILIIYALLLFAAMLLIGNGDVVGITVSPTILTVADALGISFYQAALPIQIVNGFRCLNVGTGMHMQYASGSAEVKSSAILIRVAIPCVMIYLLTFLFSTILL